MTEDLAVVLFWPVKILENNSKVWRYVFWVTSILFSLLYQLSIYNIIK